MVAGVEAAAAAGAGLHELFNYNRENFKYDREMRQKNELQILNFRLKQANLWRDDVRDIIGMTEKKMDSYLLIAVLQLGMVTGLFCEGRLEPGIPPWMLTLYVLSLGGAFVYLFMAVWFAMHASVVANCSATRLLTQFVRLPIPTWEHVEDLRTYASSFESLPWRNMLRIPFLGSRASVRTVEQAQAAKPSNGQAHGITSVAAAAPAVEDLTNARGVALSSSPAAEVVPATPEVGARVDEASRGQGTSMDSSKGTAEACADPWGLERGGDDRNLYELRSLDPGLRYHVGLARRASTQYQCFDAFCRVSMTFGTQQLLNSIMYYVLGYVAWQDGAAWPALALGVIMTGMFGTLTAVDINLTEVERLQAVILIMFGPLCSAILIVDQVLNRRAMNDRESNHLNYLFPTVCISHAAWLLWFLRAMEIEQLPNGSILPTKFRAVMYLDVFGWKDHTASEQRKEGAPQDEIQSVTLNGRRTTVEAASNVESLADDLESIRRELDADMNRLQQKKRLTASIMCPNSCGMPGHVPDSEDNFIGVADVYRDVSSEDLNAMNQLYDGTGSERVRCPTPASNSKHHVTHTCQTAPNNIFDPSSFLPAEAQDLSEDERRTISNEKRMNPGRWPAKTFHSATFLLAFLWLMGVFYPSVKQYMDYPQIDQIIAEVEEEGEVQQKVGFMGTDPNGNPMFIPVKRHRDYLLTGGVKLHTSWPSHAGFFPRAISVDSSGENGEMIVSDDIGLFAAKIEASGTDLSSTLVFKMVTPCRGLEGQALRDVSVICEHGTECKVFVLIANGPSIMECPLSGNLPNDRMEDANWSISNTWLYQQHDEEVASLAIDDDCVAKSPGSKRLGCIVVGTSAKAEKDGYGRIVQLKTHFGHENELVPNRSIHVRNSWVSPGALHVTDTGYILALSTQQEVKHRRRTETIMEAFHNDTGKLKATWALPNEVDWLTISGTDKFLMILGLRQKPWGFELWRFPLPAPLLKGSK